MTRKLALVIGNTQYADPQLSRLVSPESDVLALADLLGSDQLGQFDDVTRLINVTSSDATREIERFFKLDKYPDDLLLFYFSGHGVLDDTSELYFACSDTDMELLDSTAVSRTYLRKAMDRSRSRRQVIILDCCNSGAFGQGAKAALGSSVGTQRLVADTPMFEPGEGWITLTASDVSEVAWEGNDIVGRPQQSVFTDVLVEGLRTGNADLDCDGWVAVDELYRYLVQNVGRRSNQRPRKYDNVQGQFYIARRRPGTAAPVTLDAVIAEDLQDDRTSTRLDAVNALGRWLRSQHMGKILRAEIELKKVAQTDDSDRVKAAAARMLEQSPTEEEMTQPGVRRVASGETLSRSTRSPVPDSAPRAESRPAPPSTAPSQAAGTKAAGDTAAPPTARPDVLGARPAEQPAGQGPAQAPASPSPAPSSAGPAGPTPAPMGGPYGGPSSFVPTPVPPQQQSPASRSGPYGAPSPFAPSPMPPQGSLRASAGGPYGGAPGLASSPMPPRGSTPAPVPGTPYAGGSQFEPAPVPPQVSTAAPASSVPYGHGQAPPAAAAQRSGRGLAITSLVAGILALVLGWAPYVALVGLLAGVLGLIAGIAAISRKRSWMSVVGIILSGLGVLIGIYFVVQYASYGMI